MNKKTYSRLTAEYQYEVRQATKALTNKHEDKISVRSYKFCLSEQRMRENSEIYL